MSRAGGSGNLPTTHTHTYRQTADGARVKDKLLAGLELLVLNVQLLEIGEAVKALDHRNLVEAHIELGQVG